MKLRPSFYVLGVIILIMLSNKYGLLTFAEGSTIGDLTEYFGKSHFRNYYSFEVISQEKPEFSGDYENRTCKIEFKARIRFSDDLYAYNKFRDFSKIDKSSIPHLLKRIDYGHDEELIPKGSIYEITGYMGLAKYDKQNWHMVNYTTNERKCVHKAEAYWE